MRGHILSLSLACFVVWFVFDLVFDNYPAIVVSDEYRVLNDSPVARNATLKVSYHVTVERSCPGTGRRVFVDAGYVPQPTVPFHTDTSERPDGQKTSPGDSFDAVIEAAVPNGAAPGPATYQNETVYYCNFWQRVLRRGLPANFPKIDFVIGDQTLPKVAPSTSLFKRDRRSGMAAWLRERVGLLSSEDLTDGR